MGAFEYRQAQEIREKLEARGVRYLFLGKSGAILLGFSDTTQDADLSSVTWKIAGPWRRHYANSVSLSRRNRLPRSSVGKILSNSRTGHSIWTSFSLRMESSVSRMLGVGGWKWKFSGMSYRRYHREQGRN
jgi:hypothetical protein